VRTVAGRVPLRLMNSCRFQGYCRTVGKDGLWCRGPATNRNWLSAVFRRLTRRPERPPPDGMQQRLEGMSFSSFRSTLCRTVAARRMSVHFQGRCHRPGLRRQQRAARRGINSGCPRRSRHSHPGEPARVESRPSVKTTGAKPRMIASDRMSTTRLL